MSEENLLRARQNCCRLCLAPQTECISIINSYAADREPLATKIQNCVNIKITPNDRLSLHICHACISYLNSWQSFKNRCVSSQSKQRNWLDANKQQQLLDNNVSISEVNNTTGGNNNNNNNNNSNNNSATGVGGENGEQDDESLDRTTNILEGITSLKKRKSLTVYPLPAMPIKDEPMDTDDEYNAKHEESDEMVDPTLFLERVEHEGDMPIMDGGNYDYSAQRTAAAAVAAASLPPATVANVAAAGDNKVAQCRACNLQFSTRANARRHERNLHPNLFELSLESPNNTPITKPTPALAAALELQRAATAAATIEATKAAATGTITPQKYRQEVMNAFNKCEGGGYDYDNPEKYQHLLNDEKIAFIQQNSEFLEQYQTMTCRCCSKNFTTYKNFMAHIRKKYSTLPRNLCFNCLKQNESKALFISHLKKRNCINLYRLLNNLSTKNNPNSATPERMRAKELLINKMYECKLCPKQFRTKHEFRTHVYERHADVQRKDNASIQCSFCSLEIADPVDRKRHYNNMDCIVSLRCVTCKGNFDNHQRFLDHVYHDHLGGMSDNSSSRSVLLARQTSAENSPGKRSLSATGVGGGTTGGGGTAAGGGGGGASSNDESHSSGMALTSTPTVAVTANVHGSQQTPAKSQYFSRMPQACPICGQQYNNYNNVLRHMESKHPNNLPETYKCVRCATGFPRISNLREHMITAHGTDRNRISGGFEYIVNADALKLIDGSGGGTANVYSGRYDYVMKDLMSINGGTLDDDDDDTDSNAAKRLRLDTSLPTATVTSGSGVSSSNNNNSSNSNVNLQSSQKECPVCFAVFNNNIGLSNHMRSHTAAAANAANAAALAQANRMTPKSLTITATPSTTATLSNAASDALNATQTVTAAQEAHYRRGFEQAADRRFRRMRCQICQRRFSSKKSYRYHMFNDHQIRNVQFIKCKLCNADFAHEKGLKVHLFKVHNTLIKDDMIIKQFECDICSIVYTSESELLQHKKSIHGAEDAQAGDVDMDETAGAHDATAISSANLSGISTPVSGVNNTNTSITSTLTTGDGTVTGPLYWYQCKYCPSNFNTNKKLAIHINSHDEFDSKDYSCKDCGNVYSGRKSLWVHRYKKHPQIAEPSECVLCRKVFFDRQMLENHTPTCNRKPITATGALAETVAPTLSRPFYKHKTGDDEDDDDEDGGSDSNSGAAGTVVGTLGGGEVEVSTMPSTTSLKFKIPEVACTICGARFSDQDLFAKHIQRHEQELYTDNPLAAMFDDGPSDPNQFYLDRVNDNGEYACDLCAKTFTQMTALKVHRKWHFRGDSKQNQLDGDLAANAVSNNNNNNNSSNNSSHNSSTSIQPHLQELHAVGLMPNHQLQKQQQHSKSLKRKRELKCEYCPSTFISNNNLRRHLFELHKNEVSNLPEPPKIIVDDALSCRRCNMKFETMDEWIEHKVNDARTMRPFGPFQWGCDLCGEYVSRKEKLINHINNHHKEGVIAPIEQRKKEQTIEKSKKLPTAIQKEEVDLEEGEDANSRQSDIMGNTMLPADAEEYDDAEDYIEEDDDEDDDDDDVEEDDEHLVENDANDEHEDNDGGVVIANDDIDDEDEDDHDDHFGDADVEIVAENIEVNDDDETDEHDDDEVDAEVDAEVEDDDEDLEDVESDAESERQQKVSSYEASASGIDKKSTVSSNASFSRSNSIEKVRKDIVYNEQKEQKKVMPELTHQRTQATALNPSTTTTTSTITATTTASATTAAATTTVTVPKATTTSAAATTAITTNAEKPGTASLNGKSGNTASASNAFVEVINTSSNNNASNNNTNITNSNNNNTNNNSDSSSDSSDDDDSGDSSDSSSSSSNSTSTNSTGEARKAAAAANNAAAAAANQVKSRFACDLCQVYFDSQQDLQKHVKMHFLNGPGSVTVTNSSSSSSSVKTGAAAAKASQKSLASGSGSIDVGTK